MRINLVGAFIRNWPFGTEIAFQRGFEELGGHEITTIDTSYLDQQWDYEADVTVVFKWLEGNYWDDLKRCSGLKIVYQPDDLRFGHIQDMMRKMREYCDYALTFDADAAQALREGKYGFFYKNSQKLLVTADPGLYKNLHLERSFDIGFIGSLSGGGNHASREKMCRILSREFGNGFYAVSGVNNAAAICERYNRTKLIVNHATDVGQEFGTGYGYQCRHFEVGLTGTALLSNVVLNDDALKQPFTFCDEDSLIKKARGLINYKNWVSAGQALEDEIHRAHMPVHRAIEMVEFFKKIS